MPFNEELHKRSATVTGIGRFYCAVLGMNDAFQRR